MKSLIDPTARPAMLLVAGRSIGLATSFAIGIVFARIFDPAEFGTYKQFFLVFATLYGLVQLGMAESLYYFVPRRSSDTGRYVANAMLTLGMAGALCLALLYAGRTTLAGWLSNTELAGHVPLLGVLLTLTLMTTVFEIVMVSRKRHLAAAITYAVSDAARTTLFIVPALLFGHVRAVFIGATVFAAIRLAVVLASFWREFGRDLRIDLSLWRSQLVYALPFALAVGVEIIQINFHQYVVASRVDAATFAIYAIGCMQIPLVDLIASSTVNVLMVRMGEERSRGPAALALWHDTVCRLAFLLVPLAVFLMVMAHHVIVGLFTATYEGAVPIFGVWALAAVLPSVFGVDAVLRVFAQTRFLLYMNLLRLGLVALFIGWFMSAFGLSGAVLVTLLATMLVKLMGVARVAWLMNVPMWKALPWGRLAWITTLAGVSTAPTWWFVHSVAMPPLAAVFVGGGIYAAAYFGLSYLSTITPRMAAPQVPPARPSAALQE
jgi:O-antigen/teichoic acid export membrane protein